MGKKRRKLMSPKYRLKARALRTALGLVENSQTEQESNPVVIKNTTEIEEKETSFTSTEESTMVCDVPPTEVETKPVVKNALKQRTTRKKQTKSSSTPRKTTTTRKRASKKTTQT